MRLELTQGRGHVHVALAAVVAVEVLDTGVCGIILAGRETVVYVRADADRLVAEWARSHPMSGRQYAAAARSRENTMLR